MDTVLYPRADVAVNIPYYYLFFLLYIANGGQCWELVGKWQWQSRMAPKDMVEMDLTGIDYNMVDIYRITPPGTQNLAVNFRAMTMKKSLLKNKTHIVGIEV